MSALEELGREDSSSRVALRLPAGMAGLLRLLLEREQDARREPATHAVAEGDA